jgi:hypothetical protein
MNKAKTFDKGGGLPTNSKVKVFTINENRSLNSLPLCLPSLHSQAYIDHQAAIHAAYRLTGTVESLVSFLNLSNFLLRQEMNENGMKI